MENEKLQKLNFSHDSALTQLQKEWRDERISASQLSKEKKTEKFEVEEIRREFSDRDSSVLFIDEWKIVPASQDSVVVRSVIVLKWKKDNWQQVHTTWFLQADSSGTFRKKTEELEKSLTTKAASLKQSRDLVKKIQSQLLHQEKLASLGQLAAGIAHEIKNPLNFINNFSELSKEYIAEILENMEQMEKDAVSEDTLALLQDVQMNLDRIHDHSCRVDRIVRSMLMHSRGESGNKELTDLNALIKEYVNLSFHGMRANRHPINVDIQLDLDENIELVRLNPEDFSRVILNLCNNAYDAMRDKLMMEESSRLALAGESSSPDMEKYMPRLKVSTKQKNDSVNIRIEDNGPGVPKEIKDKLMMPFFTTKRAKEGTGLGLSITQGIVKDHNGRINISTKENVFTRFDISLPISNEKKL